MAVNAFDELLASIGESDRQVLTEVANKYPEVRNGYLRQSDYSRNMDTLRGKVALAEEWEGWKAGNWDPEHGMSRTEWDKTQLIEQLQEQAGSEAVDFEQLGKWMAEKGYVDKTTVAKEIDARAALVGEEINTRFLGIAQVAERGPVLAVTHFKNYGEVLDLTDLYKKAADAGSKSLDEYYNTVYTAEARAKQAETDTAKKIDAARAEERAATLKEINEKRGMSPNAIPADMGESEMGHFQAKLMGIGAKPKEGGIPEDAQLGKNLVSSIAAREADRAELQGMLSR